MTTCSDNNSTFILYLTQCHLNALGYNITNLYTDALAPITLNKQRTNLNKFKYPNLVYKQSNTNDFVVVSSGLMYTFGTRYTLVNDIFIQISLDNDNLLCAASTIKCMEDYDIYKYINVLNHCGYKNDFQQEDFLKFELVYNNKL
jgi:hypothetical protein